MRLGFTGTQEGRVIKLERWTRFCVFVASHLSDITEFHHGDCVGADATAHLEIYRIFNHLTIKPIIHIHPPIKGNKRAFCRTSFPGWTVVIHEEKDYLERNRDIVDHSDVLYAMPKDPFHEERRSGTWATVRYARAQRKRILGVAESLGGDLL